MLYHSLTAAVLLTGRVLAAPAPIIEQRQDASGSGFQGLPTNTAGDIFNVPTATPDPPPGSSGQLRGNIDLVGYNPSNPISDKSAVVPQDDFQLVPGQEANPDLGFYLDLASTENPQPIRGYSKKLPTDPGPQNEEIQKQNPDLFAPVGTDNDVVPNIKWPMGLSFNRHGIADAGWSRQENIQQLPVATAMAGVDMYLSPNAYRELHWHRANEWAYIFNGSARVQAVDEDGQTFVDDLQAGDVWFFPAGKPHSIQAFDTGCEFLLVFDEGEFSDSNTFLVSELFLRNPKSVLAKDLRVDVSAFDNLPPHQLYIFEGQPAPKDIEKQNVTGPAGIIPLAGTYSYHFSQQAPLEVPGGSVKILDPLTFPIASNFAVGLFTVKPGAMRELHWHTTSDEWSFILAGQGRLTTYTAPITANTYDFQAGDVGYVPYPNAHYLENTGDTDLVYLEILQSPIWSDISVAQWLGLTPKRIVKDHLGFSEDTLNRLPQIKPFILPGDKNLLQTNFTEEVE